MRSDLAHLRERVRQTRAALEAAGRPDPDRRARDAARAIGSFVRGARVFDLVSGEEGEVVGGTRQNSVVPGL